MNTSNGDNTGANTHRAQGNCLCGNITLIIEQFKDNDVVACHCSQCRKQTGHFFAASHVLNTQLTIKGQDSLSWYRASDEAERGFCHICGSILMWRLIGADNTAVLAGCLDSPTGLKLTHHIFVDDKGDYYDIDDGARTYPQSD